MTSQKKGMREGCWTSVWLLPRRAGTCRDSVTCPALKPKAGSKWQGTCSHSTEEAQSHAGHVNVTEA